MFEIISLSLFALILAADLLLVIRRPHRPGFGESLAWCLGYAALALLFAVVLYFRSGLDYAGMFIAGWITEYSLSMDNLFVFALIIGARFAVPAEYQQRVIMVGIIVAVVLRAIFILLGAALISTFSWIFFFFGFLLLYTAYKQVMPEKEHSSPLMDKLRQKMRISREFDGGKLRTGPAGSRQWTPMILVFISIGFTDLIFALDSIPAVFGITTDSFLVFSANFFSLMGLRQLYFLLSNCMERLEYMKYGVAAVLAFIGVKLILEAGHSNGLPFLPGSHAWFPVINVWTSLVVIVTLLGISIAVSLLKTRADAGKAEQ